MHYMWFHNGLLLTHATKFTWKGEVGDFIRLPFFLEYRIHCEILANPSGSIRV